MFKTSNMKINYIFLNKKSYHFDRHGRLHKDVLWYALLLTMLKKVYNAKNLRIKNKISDTLQVELQL